jgi:hypothetical protein
MPVTKKTTDNTKKTTKNTKNTESIQIENVSVQQVKIKDDCSEKSDDNTKNNVRKAGRTLLVSPASGSSLNDSFFKDLSGLTSNFSTKNNSHFITFDTVENAIKCYSSIRSDHPNVKVKYSRYQVFFTISGLTKESDYTAAKKVITEFVEEKTSGMVLFFKLYRKGDNFIGCGDMTLDTKDSMDKLISKDGEFKNSKIAEFELTFYRYNKNPKTEGDGQKVNNL